MGTISVNMERRYVGIQFKNGANLFCHGGHRSSSMHNLLIHKDKPESNQKLKPLENQKFVIKSVFA